MICAARFGITYSVMCCNHHETKNRGDLNRDINGNARNILWLVRGHQHWDSADVHLADEHIEQRRIYYKSIAKGIRKHESGHISDDLSGVSAISIFCDRLQHRPVRIVEAYALMDVHNTIAYGAVS